MKLLETYYEGRVMDLGEGVASQEAPSTVGDDEVGLLEESLAPRKQLPPLLMKLSERPAERLDYLGVSFGLTSDLLRYVMIVQVEAFHFILPNMLFLQH